MFLYLFIAIGLLGDVGQENPVVGRIIRRSRTRGARHGPGTARREPLPHVRTSTGFLYLADLGPGARFGTLGLALLLGFLFRFAEIVLATTLEAIVATSAHALPRSWMSGAGGRAVPRAAGVVNDWCPTSGPRGRRRPRRDCA